MAEVKVGQASQIPPGTATVVTVEGKAIALFNVAGTLYATANECTHVGGPLGGGRLDGPAVTCPWHGSQFDVTSGQALKGPARRPVATYRVRVEGTDVFVALD